MVILSGTIGNYVQVNETRHSFFAGNNYLGLAGHPAIKKEVIRAVRKYGVNFSASRQTTGTSELHNELEDLLSGFKNKPDSVTFASGYMGNRIILEALRDRYSALFIDESSHPSIRDGIPQGISRVFYYRHCDPDHLQGLLKKNKKHKPLIITDGIFALTGEIAPLDIIYRLSREFDATIVVDDAHATGILGETGKGTPEHFMLSTAENIFQTETMSKALGAYGGFISAGKQLIRSIRSGSPIYMASTSIPPALASAGCASVRILMDHPELRVKVLKNAAITRNSIINLGYQTISGITPVIPLLFNNQDNAMKLSGFLMENRFIVPYVNYPGNRDKFLLRLTVSARHTRAQIDELSALLKKWKDKHGSNKD